MKKYQEIFNDLQEKILNGSYLAGVLLPTEKELQDQYGVSRDTVRKALRLLTEKGLIQKVQGRGSQVLKQELLNFPVSGLTSYKELVDSLGLNSQTRVISLDLMTVDEQTALQTGFPEGSQVWKLLRTRSIDGIVSVLDLDYLAKDCVPNLTQEIAQTSIYAHLEEELGLDISYAQKEITIQASTERERLLMDNQDDYLVLIRSRVYLGDTRQFQYTESRHKIDKFQFVDFARRKHSL
ncbi:trehalose operon repressor [Streptococcus sp.]|uniref:trehalose operon repressor n=1 Tax=Streptococcus sp. TaxID=1306 RepID=UPI00359F1BEB